MILKLRFDVMEEAVFIPDGYVHDVKILQRDFFEWAEDQSETFVSGPGGMICRRYSCDLFLRYVNTCILAQANEMAYPIRLPEDTRKCIPVLAF